MSFLPLVSIVIPVFNGQDYILESIESAITQTYQNIEVIVVNDGSTDNTESILQPYFDRIRYFKKENGGVSSALNLAIEKMNGEYFSWLSHDDLYLKNKISSQISFIEKLNNKEIVLYGDYKILYDFGFFKISRRKYFNHKHLMLKPAYALLRGCLNGITMLIPKKILITNGWFDEELSCVQDYDYWSRLIFQYDFIHLRGPNAVTRIHSRQVTKTNHKCLAEGNKFWTSIIKKIPNEVFINYEGSKRQFYKKFIRFLASTPYKQAYNNIKLTFEEIFLNDDQESHE